MVNLDYYANVYFGNGEDVPFKLRDGSIIYIKPVLMKDYTIYQWACQVVQLLKNETNDFKVIQMSYLQYLVEVVFPQDEEVKDNKDLYQSYKDRFIYLMQICLNVERLAILPNEKGKWQIVLCDNEDKVQHIITAKEFDDIVFIILNQNDPKHDNRYIDPDARKVMQDYYDIKYRGITSPSLEKRKAFVCSKIGKTFKELSLMTIREFDLIYHACVDSEIYIATKVTEASYKYDVKDPTKHPLFEPEKDMFEEVFSSTDTLEGKGFKGAENIGVGID